MRLSASPVEVLALFGEFGAGAETTPQARAIPHLESARPISRGKRDPLPPGHTARRWGVGLKMRDGSVVIELDPWEAKDSCRHYDSFTGSCV
jgi:hypothetical protein